MSLGEFRRARKPLGRGRRASPREVHGGVYAGLRPRGETGSPGRTDPRERASGLYTGRIAGPGLRVLPATRMVVWRPRWFST